MQMAFTTYSVKLNYFKNAIINFVISVYFYVDQDLKTVHLGFFFLILCGWNSDTEKATLLSLKVWIQV